MSDASYDEAEGVVASKAWDHSLFKRLLAFRTTAPRGCSTQCFAVLIGAARARGARHCESGARTSMDPVREARELAHAVDEGRALALRFAGWPLDEQAVRALSDIDSAPFVRELLQCGSRLYAGL